MSFLVLDDDDPSPPCEEGDDAGKNLSRPENVYLGVGGFEDEDGDDGGDCVGVGAGVSVTVLDA